MSPLGNRDWNPGTYARFRDLRLRPALDLMARIGEVPFGPVIDLGCGNGAVAMSLAVRFPGHALVGVDASPAMLAEAVETRGYTSLVEADIATWKPFDPVSVVFSNAALHWLDGHDTLMPRLAAMLVPGGVLAVQMPRNWSAPSHVLVREAAEELDFGEKIGPDWVPVAEPAFYYDLMAPLAAHLDIWETTYVQPLEGDNPVVDWIRSTALQPVMDKLDADEAEAFLSLYGEKVRAAYPKRSNGITLFPFRRLFIVAMAGA